MKEGSKFFFSTINRPLLYLWVVLFMLAACGGGHEEGSDLESDQETEAAQEGSEQMDKTTRKILYSIPSPLEMAILIKQASAAYNMDLLNPIENADKYSTSYQQALNLGIYGADLSYTSMFDQTQESLFYLSCARKLADRLGIAGAFDDKTIDRLDMYKDNKDSVMEIISDAYWATDSYLKESERFSTSSLVIAGGWIEGLYIASKIAMKSNTNEQIRTRIADQKSSLENLLGLLESGQEDEEVAKIVKQLRELKAIFDAMPVSEAEPVTASTNEGSGVTTIGGGSSAVMNDEQLAKITEKISEIRNGIIRVN